MFLEPKNTGKMWRKQ